MIKDLLFQWFSVVIKIMDIRQGVVLSKTLK
jgi:hypothetical protein